MLNKWHDAGKHNSIMQLLWFAIKSWIHDDNDRLTRLAHISIENSVA